MKDAGYAHMGVGRAEGKDRADWRPVRPWPAPCWKPLSMARAACLSTSPVPRIWILRTSTRRRRSSPARLIPDATIIWGAAFDENLGDTLCVTVIATGLVSDNSYKAKEPEGTPLASFGQKVENVASSVEDDEGYTDIMGIFKKKRD